MSSNAGSETCGQISGCTLDAVVMRLGWVSPVVSSFLAQPQSVLDEQCCFTMAPRSSARAHASIIVRPCWIAVLAEQNSTAVTTLSIRLCMTPAAGHAWRGWLQPRHDSRR